MFMTLVRKDFRLQMPVLIAAGLLFVAPALVYLAANVIVDERQGDSQPWRAALLMLTVMGIATSSLTFPAFAGVAAARERRERSGEFLESLPVERWRIVASRVLTAVACAAAPVVIGGGIIVLLLATEAAAGPHSASAQVFGPGGSDDTHPLWVGGAMLLSSAGIAWFVGTIVRSEVISSALGIAIPIALQALTFVTLQRLSSDTLYRLGIANDALWAYVIVQLAVAIPALVAGLAVALSRKTP